MIDGIADGTIVLPGAKAANEITAASGKTMIPFATSGSSGIEQAEQSLQAHCPSAIWKTGKLLNHTDVAAWAKAAVKN